MIITCWRCGVDFNSSLYRSGAPCADCQLDVPGDWRKDTSVPRDAESVVARQDRVRELNAVGFLDAEIADRMGMPARSISQIRRRLGLPRRYKSGMYLWKDEEAHIEHAKQLVQHRKTHKRGKSAYEVHNGR